MAPPRRARRFASRLERYTPLRRRELTPDAAAVEGEVAGGAEAGVEGSQMPAGKWGSGARKSPKVERAIWLG